MIDKDVGAELPEKLLRSIMAAVAAAPGLCVRLYDLNIRRQQAEGRRHVPASKSLIQGFNNLNARHRSYRSLSFSRSGHFDSMHALRAASSSSMSRIPASNASAVMRSGFGSVIA